MLVATITAPTCSRASPRGPRRVPNARTARSSNLATSARTSSGSPTHQAVDEQRGGVSSDRRRRVDAERARAHVDGQRAGGQRDRVGDERHHHRRRRHASAPRRCPAPGCGRGRSTVTTTVARRHRRADPKYVPNTDDGDRVHPDVAIDASVGTAGSTARASTRPPATLPTDGSPHNRTHDEGQPATPAEEDACHRRQHLLHVARRVQQAPRCTLAQVEQGAGEDRDRHRQSDQRDRSLRSSAAACGASAPGSAVASRTVGSSGVPQKTPFQILAIENSVRRLDHQADCRRCGYSWPTNARLDDGQLATKPDSGGMPARLSAAIRNSAASERALCAPCPPTRFSGARPRALLDQTGGEEQRRLHRDLVDDEEHRAGEARPR